MDGHRRRATCVLLIGLARGAALAADMRSSDAQFAPLLHDGRRIAVEGEPTAATIPGAVRLPADWRVTAAELF